MNTKIKPKKWVMVAIFIVGYIIPLIILLNINSKIDSNAKIVSCTYDLNTWSCKYE